MRTTAGRGPEDARNLLTRVDQLLAEGRTFCLSTVIASEDPALPVGAKAIVFPDGSVDGEANTASLPEPALAAAASILELGTSRIAEIPGGAKLFLDVLSAAQSLLICGAGHIAVALAKFAREVGFAVTVLDDRPDFAHPARFPGCEAVAAEFESALAGLRIDTSTYVVVITRGHEHDLECLRAILPRDTAYVGLIGSKRRIRFVLESLSRDGVPDGRIGDVFTPIGLPLHAESPQEIALSIAAELVCVRNAGAASARALREHRIPAAAHTARPEQGQSAARAGAADLFRRLAELRDQGKAVALATVVDTVGSTPRAVGAKMLVTLDGSVHGSIGGGCGEGIVKSTALRQLVRNTAGELVLVDLRDELGSREADVCGGRMWVFVENAGMV